VDNLAIYSTHTTIRPLRGKRGDLPVDENEALLAELEAVVGLQRIGVAAA
jgi:hypothetical protein